MSTKKNGENRKKQALREVIGGAAAEDLLAEVSALGSLTDRELEQVAGGAGDSTMSSAAKPLENAKTDSRNPGKEKPDDGGKADGKNTEKRSARW